MNKHHTVKNNREFDTIIKTGKFAKNKVFVIYYKEHEQSNYRFGVSVGKKIGNAVVRNKIKRQVRFLIDKYKNFYQNNLDYIIMIRNGYVGLEFVEVEKEFLNIIQKIQRYTMKENIDEKIKD